MIKEAATKLNVSEGQVEYFEKEGATKLMRFLDKIVNSSFIDRHISDRYGYVNERSYVDVISKIVLELYEEGNVVIIGRGSQFILKDRPNAYHIQLVEELESRINFIMTKYNLSYAEAEKTIKQRDQIRSSFLSFFHDKGHIDDPLNYDLVFNMDRVTMDKTEDLIVELIRD
jgi:cytidylate kinase